MAGKYKAPPKATSMKGKNAPKKGGALPAKVAMPIKGKNRRGSK